jgi:hypothetical protein
MFLANRIDSERKCATSVNQGSAGYFASKDLFQFGVGIRSTKNDDFAFKCATN